MHPYLRLLRPQQWVKNFFVLLPSFFAGRVLDYTIYRELLLAFVSFSLVSSAVYILNDYNDIDHDRMHPVKRYRPLADGSANKNVSFVLMILLFAVGVGVSFLLDRGFLWMLMLYIVINIAYTFGLKHISIVDIFLVSAGFLIRVYAGGFAASIPVSHWLALMIMLLALFLTLAKRRDDLVNTNVDGTIMRKSSRKYNMVFVNSCLVLFAGIIIVSYIMYTVSAEVVDRFNSEWLYATVIFVIAGLMRYLQITFVEERTGNPSQILVTDGFIITCILGWIMMFYIIIYAS
jgi:4-hydroxybenzoate polyprenyltransferase